ncbi:MAG: YbaB/EbfC family nucleoid-associated protein [Hyphomicrobiales bacterium]|nr:YbaB/EbfC family nucleoid-associated protein [Hyphomicrobiales bacterium]MDE2017355.1 YbaB/EbfC family nucleoid-associated protein [Hyphomicrobiales bacterium]
MRDMMGLMKQAQAMQARLKAAQDELADLTVEGQAGGGAVKVTLAAKGGMKAIAIDPSLLKPEEAEMLEDLILAAHEDARGKADRLVEERMKGVTAGMPLPPGMKLPF